MITISKNWDELKVILSSKKLLLQFYEENNTYKLVAIDGILIYLCDIQQKDGCPKVAEFETYYKSYSNKPYTSYAKEGKPSVIASSRPNETQTCFTTRGDDLYTGSIGQGTRMDWDFSNELGSIDAPSGYKRKRIELQFIDPIWLKEGTLYYFNKLKGSYGDCYLVCPDGGWYPLNDGTLVQTSEDTQFVHYVIEHPMQDSVPMGDELNTEETQENALPAYYKLVIEITVPEADSSSNGCIEFELYRYRTMNLP